MPRSAPPDPARGAGCRDDGPPGTLGSWRELLAHRIGDELGSAFEVEFHVPPGVWFGPRFASYRSEHEPTNPAAAAAFEAIAEAHRRERKFWDVQAAARARPNG